MITLSFSPMISTSAFWLLAAITGLVAVLWLTTRGWQAVWRCLALAFLFLALLDPSLVKQDVEPVKSIVAVVTDRSSSQNLGDRPAMTDAVRAEIAANLAGKKDIEARFIDVGDAPNDGGTLLFSALASALADIPPNRIAGAILISDGVIHDIPENRDRLGFSGPVHALVTGRDDERDRQVRFLNTPRFGIVGKQTEIRAIVDERGGTGMAQIVVRQNGREIASRTVATQTPFAIPVTIDRAGDNIIELEVAALESELTLLNNRAILDIEGIRDRLRVLLVSGQPHPGERAWRNLLKSDPNVELVHFTILRPADKAASTPIDELALIAFPIHDLFVNRLRDFDLVIFDRYANQGYIPSYYFDNIAKYLSDGGAMLIAAGPEYVARTSLAFTALSALLPAKPRGELVERRFRPSLADVGRRHPVTRGLAGSETSPPAWGEWFRIISADAAAEKTLLNGPDDAPLLVLDHAGKGRIALLLSDQIWLWARGYENGGPYLDFQRRLVHWLMKEPSLEEEALRASASGQVIHVKRQTMKDDPDAVTLEMPDGSSRSVVLTKAKPGLFTADVSDTQNGMHVLKSGDLVSFVSIGPASPREFVDVFSSTEHLRPIAEATGGSVRRIVRNNDTPAIPRIETGNSGSRLYGSDWISFRPNDNAIVRGVSLFPAGTGFLALLVLAGLSILAWVVEGRNGKPEIRP